MSWIVFVRVIGVFYVPLAIATGVPLKVDLGMTIVKYFSRHIKVAGDYSCDAEFVVT